MKVSTAAASSLDRVLVDRAGSARQVLDRPGFTDGVLPAACPTRVVLDHITSKWGVLVLIALTDHSLRWGELRRVVQGISEKMLAQTLRVLEADGFVLREAQPTIPPRVDYSLTDRGREVAGHLQPLLEWIATNAADIVSGPPAGGEPTPAMVGLSVADERLRPAKMDL